MLSAGKRLLFVSGSDYEEAMEPLIFSRGDMLCGWNEPPLGAVDGTPQCQINQQGLVEVNLAGPAVGQHIPTEKQSQCMCCCACSHPPTCLATRAFPCLLTIAPLPSLPCCLLAAALAV